MKRDLREFVYLDEVSLRSLLSSLSGDLRESRSEQTADEIQVEAASSVGASNPLIGSAELSSRFQTTNSSTIQTSRKATVQSWFKDFRAIPKLRLIEVVQPEKAAVDLEALLSTTDTSLLLRDDDLTRGELVEFRVKLSADPVYHLSTMMSEFAGMAGDYPDMFAAREGLKTLREAGPVNKILERLLAGLIPIRATAVDHSVITLDGVKYVVHNALAEGLGLKIEPLHIVGVTEHLAYWKDIRRVLFSEAQFTLLGRVSRDGLRPTWTPVKLADLFQSMVPDFVEKINLAGLLPFGAPQPSPTNPIADKLALALLTYSNSVLRASAKNLEEAEEKRLWGLISGVSDRFGSASAQRSAFSIVGEHLRDVLDSHVSPETDMELRDRARTQIGLSLFPALDSEIPPKRTEPDDDDGDDDDDDSDDETVHLVDIEVIAIYW